MGRAGGRLEGTGPEFPSRSSSGVRSEQRSLRDDHPSPQPGLPDVSTCFSVCRTLWPSYSWVQSPEPSLVAVARVTMGEPFLSQP